MNKLYEKLARLPLKIDGYGLEPHSLTVVGGNKRQTTVIALHGNGLTGRGEDVTYETQDQLNLQQAGTYLQLSGLYTFGEFCEYIDGLDLFPSAPHDEVYRRYRRWAFESAALDLALRQAGTSLADFLEIAPQPVRFVVSQRLGNPSRIDLLQARLDQYPDLQFKLDATNDWSDELIEQLVATGAVESIDLKGFYRGTPVDVNTDPVLYAKLLKTFPNAWFEDPDVTNETQPILKPHADRITWDAPLHTAEDILNMPFRSKMINVKPSRFGSVEELFKVYELCAKENIKMYSGGQFELNVGRTHIQYLASLFHADGPNDCSPIAYHEDKLPSGLPSHILGLRDLVADQILGLQQ